MGKLPSASTRLIAVTTAFALVLLVPAVATAARGKSPVAKLCQKDGWVQLTTASGAPFASEGDCTSYAALGGKLGQTITFTSTNPSPVKIDDASYTPQASASSGLSVTFSLDATSSGCTLVSGVVSFTAVGTCKINADQGGNAIWAAAPQVQQSITVNPKTQTITFTSTNPSPVHAGDPDYTPTATATSGLGISFSLDGSSSGCTITGGVVSFTAAGTCVVDADQAGDATWAAAPQVSQSITVVVDPETYCESLGGTFGGQTATALWTCNDWTASSAEDADAKVDPLVDACRVDNGLRTGPLDISYTTPFPTEVDARCHLPAA
jgi:hypothetical protein